MTTATSLIINEIEVAIHPFQLDLFTTGLYTALTRDNREGYFKLYTEEHNDYCKLLVELAGHQVCTEYFKDGSRHRYNNSRYDLVNMYLTSDVFPNEDDIEVEDDEPEIADVEPLTIYDVYPVRYIRCIGERGRGREIDLVSNTGLRLDGEDYTFLELAGFAEYSADRENWHPCHK